MNIAIIPARGGSKRLPGKNVKPLAGQPLITWTIEAAVQSKEFDHVFVSTDCHDIAAISLAYGAEVPFLRPKSLATDEATTNDVITHFVEWFEVAYNKEISTIAILQPTSPLRNARHIQEAVQLMREKSAKAVVSVCEVEYPMQLCNKLPSNGSLDGFIDQGSLKRTQDLEKYYRLNGAIYLFKREYVSKLSYLYSEGTFPYIMSSTSSVDIDTHLDFLVASAVLEKGAAF